MKRAIVAVAFAVVALLSSPSAANAYLNLINAQNACGQNTRAPANGWFQNNGFGPWWEFTYPSGNDVAHAYNRYGDENIDVLVGHYSYYNGEADVVCRVIGPNSSPGVWYGNGYPRWVYLGPYSPGWPGW